jgi:DNA-binding CsgD family transcriptional regulator
MTEALEAGKKALAAGEWQEARRHFESALKQGESPEALDGLAWAASWLSDEKTTFEARERAYRVFLERGDRASAARMAVWLCIDSREFRGDSAIAHGWLQRAHRLLEGSTTSFETGLLVLAQGMLDLMEENDTESALTGARKAAAAGRLLKNTDLEMVAVALEGLALVSSGRVPDGMRLLAPPTPTPRPSRSGRVPDGMRLLDEAGAAALAGEMTDLTAVGTVYCFLIDACDRIRDYGRAEQWCQRITDFTRRNHMEALTAFCRPHYAVLLMWRGALSDAEKELNTAVAEMKRVRPPMVTEGTVRLADLRVRQGRFKEAETLLRQVEHEPLAQLSRAGLALAEGDAATAVEMAERYLRRIPADNAVERAGGLEMMVRAKVAQGDLAAASRHLSEFETAAAAVGTAPLHAAVEHAAGLLALARGDHEGARPHLEDAVDTYNRAGAAMETAMARTALAQCLHALNRTQAATREASLAFDSLRRVGAPREAEKAAAVLRSLASARAAENPADVVEAGVLTPREVEVLKLMAAGKSNAEISALMVLSVRTVERHISNIYSKIGADGKTGRASATAYAYSRGLVKRATKQ